MNQNDTHKIAEITEIHNGDVITHHDQSTTPVNFSINNTKNNVMISDIIKVLLSLFF